MLALTFFGWRVTDWPLYIETAVGTAALLTALTVIYKKGWKPLRALYLLIKALVVRANEALDLVELHLAPNHGTSMLDKINNIQEKVDVLETEISQIKGHAQMLLEHDDKRDTPGLRYGHTTKEIVNVPNQENL